MLSIDAARIDGAGLGNVFLHVTLPAITPTGTLLAIVPPAILFFALQREFISGLTSGALKQ